MSDTDININVHAPQASQQQTVHCDKTNEKFDLSDGIQTQEEAVYDMEQKKLSTRKKMAWFSLSGILGVLVGCFVIYFASSFDLERFSAVRPLIETCIFSLTSIVGFFIGSQTFAESKWAKDGVEKSD